jgi:hypothetical protein
MPSLPTIFVRSSGETRSDHTPVEISLLCYVAIQRAAWIRVEDLVPVLNFAVSDHYRNKSASSTQKVTLNDCCGSVTSL